MHKFKKSFGQNFLVHQNTAKKIASFLNKETKNVIEIGPGEGMLTKELLDLGFNVYSIEIDRDLHPVLEEKFKDFPNFKLTKGDVMEFDLKDLTKDFDSYSVTGNLPYNISKQIIRLFLETEYKPSEILVMLQKEVAENYTEKAPNATFLSNFVNIYGKAEKVYTVKKEQFFPRPKVDGEILKINIDPVLQENIKLEKISKFIKQGFSAPRKTLTNVLKEYDKKIISAYLKSRRYKETARAQEIETPDWIELYNLVSTF